MREPSQGWKLHVSATVLDACSVFENIAPFLVSRKVQFKAPNSLMELAHLNSGLYYGYSQVGKFVTIYPPTIEEAAVIAKELHRLTAGFAAPAIPFDERFRSNSCVYYRYGAFRSIDIINAAGNIESSIWGPGGKLVADDRFRPVPEWLMDPFKGTCVAGRTPPIKKTPLNTRFLIVKAVTQRGKGGVYKALDLGPGWAGPCIIKEGRKNGEASWNGFDGHTLAQNERWALEELGRSYEGVPKVFSAFEIDDSYYVAMEYVEGKSLFDIMKTRRRRFSVKQTMEFCLMIARIIEKIHNAGWVWNDCKPANLIVTAGKNLRPIDFEGASRMGEPAPFEWKTQEFSMPAGQFSNPRNNGAGDLYALGTVAYFLLTGKFFEPENPVAVSKLRPGVNTSIREAVDELIHPGKGRRYPSIFDTRKRFESILRDLAGSKTCAFS
jgi:hypothetical protein